MGAKNRLKLSPDRRSFLKAAICSGAAATLAPAYPALGAARELGVETVDEDEWIRRAGSG